MKTTSIAGNSIAVAAFALASAMAPAANAQSAPAPTLKVGDRWVYNVKSGIGLATTTYQETREVTAVGGGGAKIKVTGKTADGKDFTRVDDYSGPGALRSGALCYDEHYRFPTPLQRVAFPITSGQRSSKWVDVLAEPGGGKGQINYSSHTRGWEKQTTPAGAFDAIRVDALMVLDDATPFRNGTTCNVTYWYSPAVKAVVRERRAAQYLMFDQHEVHKVLNAYYELASYTPAKP